jgi:hypothetical protein
MIDLCISLLCQCLKNSAILHDGLDVYIFSPTRDSLSGRWCHSVDGCDVRAYDNSC